MAQQAIKTITAGWDIGGAHLKAAVAQDGRILGAWQTVCPIWQGRDKLDAAFAEIIAAMAAASMPNVSQHVCTMTAELSDIFASRAAGVAALAEIAARHLGDATCVYAGRAGFVAARAAAAHSDDIASANWHASAAFVARRMPNALLIDIGSTTTDIVPVIDGAVAARGYSDAERLVAGELVYTGVVRSFLMSITAAVPFKGAQTPLMHEYFANMGDVYRVLGELPEGADLQATADGRDKSLAASRARLARMIGRDVSEGGLEDWRLLALAFKRAQMRTVETAVLQVLSGGVAADAPLVAAGAGAPVVEVIAAGLRRRCFGFASLLNCAPEVAAMAGACAPASALALLAAAKGNPGYMALERKRKQR